MEKYHRWFEEFPATYMVFQAIHKTESDLFGRHLGAWAARAAARHEPGRFGQPGYEAVPPGEERTHDVVFAFLQPFPNYIISSVGRPAGGSGGRHPGASRLPLEPGQQLDARLLLQLSRRQRVGPFEREHHPVHRLGGRASPFVSATSSDLKASKSDRRSSLGRPPVFFLTTVTESTHCRRSPMGDRIPVLAVSPEVPPVYITRFQRGFFAPQVPGRRGPRVLSTGVLMNSWDAIAAPGDISKAYPTS